MDNQNFSVPGDKLIRIPCGETEAVYESLGVILLEKTFYAVALPDGDEEADAVILRMVSEGGRLTYVVEEDEAAADAVWEEFVRRYGDEYEFASEETMA